MAHHKSWLFAVCLDLVHDKHLVCLFEMTREKNLLLCRVLNKAHGKAWLCLAMCQIKHTAKHDFAVCYIFTVCPHSKEVLYRVPHRKHMANYRAQDKEPDSGSEVIR